MGNSCFRYRKEIEQLKKEHQLEINYVSQKFNNIINKQQIEINNLDKKIFELNQRCDQLLLDYYNLENDYAKCKTELSRCQSNLGSYRNIFSL